MEPILELQGVTKKFPKFLLKDVSFTLKPGYIMGFIGANGAGKSTTIKLIMNLLRRDGGEIRVFGLDLLRHEHEIKNRIGFVYDENHFYEELTIKEMKTIIAPFYQDWDDSVYKRLIKDFELPENQKIKDLSKGMKMKFSLAIALSHHAELLLMDEPTSGLDPLIRSDFLEILSEVIQDEKCSVLFSTHITSDLDRIADYITLIHEGKILFSMGKDDLLESHALIKGEKSLLGPELSKYLVGYRENQFGFEGLVKNKEELQPLLTGRAILERPSLEDIMLYCTRGNAACSD